MDKKKLILKSTLDNIDEAVNKYLDYFDYASLAGLGLGSALIATGIGAPAGGAIITGSSALSAIPNLYSSARLYYKGLYGQGTANLALGLADLLPISAFSKLAKPLKYANKGLAKASTKATETISTRGIRAADNIKKNGITKADFIKNQGLKKYLILKLQGLNEAATNVRRSANILAKLIKNTAILESKLVKKSSLYAARMAGPLINYLPTNISSILGLNWDSYINPTEYNN